MVICLMTDISTRIFAEWTANNWIILAPFCMIELYTFSLLYHKLIDRKKWVIIANSLGLFYILSESIYLHRVSMLDYQSYSRTVSTFLIIGMVFMYLFEQLQKSKRISFRKLYFHGLVAAYFVLELIFILPLNFLINGSESMVLMLWFIRIFLLLSFYIALSQWIWRNGKCQQQLHSGY